MTPAYECMLGHYFEGWLCSVDRLPLAERQPEIRQALEAMVEQWPGDRRLEAALDAFDKAGPPLVLPETPPESEFVLEVKP